MKAVTKEQCEAALGSISDAIEVYCLVVNKDVYQQIGSRAGRHPPADRGAREAAKGTQKAIVVMGQGSEHMARRNVAIVAGCRIRGRIKISGCSVGVVSMSAPKCRACETKRDMHCGALAPRKNQIRKAGETHPLRYTWLHVSTLKTRKELE